MARPFVDRIEGKVAVLIVDGAEKRVPLRSLPAGVREGSWLTEDLKAIATEEAQATASEIAERRARLKKDDGGDFSL